MSAVRHVLGLSGGRDSAALAIYMREHHPELPIEYFFTDTGSELPEVYEYLSALEAHLGTEIQRLNPNQDFEHWLREYNHFLPSVQQRWCTRQLKLRPFENWLKPTLANGGRVVSYVAIRADENRSGYRGDTTGVEVKFPFVESGVDKAGVIRILKDSAVGMPAYYDWRSRSGCTFCFFQQKAEWVGLYERHPEAFAHAQSLEKDALEHGSPFTWSEAESLADLSKEERRAEIKADFALRQERTKKNARAKARMGNPYLDASISDEELDELLGFDDIYGVAEINASCVVCHK
jgi:3'-phosphoadenosine 5'-phosphosulfate sulfotransferase (PAPS reductase)/FAD synthetase